MHHTRSLRRYDHTCRDDALALLEGSKDPISAVPSSLGIPTSTLYSWYRQARGVLASKRRVERAMRAMGLTPPTPSTYRKTTIQNPDDAPAPNALDRDFVARRPNERWVADIT